MMITRADCLALDAADPCARHRAKFHVPQGMIYLDGNSLGLMPEAAAERVQTALRQEWAEDLITSWNKNGWFNLPQTTGDKIARLLGAAPGQVIVADTISVNLFKVLTAALKLRPGRKLILSDHGNFPSDLYVAQGLARFMADGHELRNVAPEDVEAAIDDSIAVVMVTEVDYRSARRHDMKAITRKAHAAGALVICDLAHSAGAIPVTLIADDIDFAVGCTYKYLNGGPGAPAFIFVHPRHHASAESALVGWWGHADPFSFSPEWSPAHGVTRMQCGTQAILSLTALDAALDVWSDADMAALHAKGQALSRIFIAGVEARCGKHGLRLAGPRDMDRRGSHVSFACPDGYAVMQALIARKVIGDFRAPDLIRLGFAPLYNTHVEAFDAAVELADVLDSGAWQDPRYRSRNAVT